MTFRFPIPPLPFAAIFLGFVFSFPGSAAEVDLPAPSPDGEGIEVSGGEGAPVLARISPGSKGTPGVVLSPGDSPWDFSRHSRLEAVVSNTGDEPLPVSLRVDNAGHWKTSPWSTEMIRLNPGDTKTLTVFFGYSHGWQPSFDLDRSAVTRLLFFTSGAAKERSFTILSVTAIGEPDETPEQWKSRAAKVPVDGILFSEGMSLESSRQVSAAGGAFAKGEEGILSVDLVGRGGSASYRPPSGQWDLRDFNHVEIAFRNTGSSPLSLAAQVDSTGGSTSVAKTEAVVPPGETGTLLIPFASPQPWNVEGDPASGNQDTGGGFVSKAVSSLTFRALESGGTFAVTGIRATAPPADLPEWSGTRPPIEGEWNLTFREEFAAPFLDDSIWNIYTANHWDKRAHFSKENVLLEDGAAKLRFERKEGFHNDDPTEKKTLYATGFLDTFGKWKQRYGYFECRLKLPSAPGLWPAFWMMPDRGPAEAPRWKREQTSNGGMEFDIMEYLSGWGPYRYNVAFHWDGYGKNHQHFGTSSIYFQHDEEGFITVGMLWLPGEVVYYCNGRPVGRWKSDRVSNVPSILMFTHVSGGWDNTPLDDTKLPSDFEIDYVRVWQRADLAE